MSELDRYDFELPARLIAQAPLPRRSDARLLVVDRQAGVYWHQHIRDLPEVLDHGDILVLNDTKVIPARLVGRRPDTGGRWEGLFLEADAHGLWRILAKTRGKQQPGDRVVLLDRDLRDSAVLFLVEKHADGSWIAAIESDANDDAETVLERIGRVPLPHYIRKGEMVDDDRETYQTVYARKAGAVAAPTAGLHFTEELLEQLAKRGIQFARVTLHVGVGTFKPIKSDTLAGHRMHAERGVAESREVDKILRAKAAGGRVVAVGTTSLRVLETAAAGGSLKPWRGETDLFIRPPFQCRAADALLTNFHLPRTTLLVLVRTFGGEELICKAYEEAIREEYRFYSYGDAMLIL